MKVRRQKESSLLVIWVISALMLLGMGVLGPLLLNAETTKGMAGLSIALIAVFLCPRLIFYPILSRGKRHKASRV
jgi:hypothetical protein